MQVLNGISCDWQLRAADGQPGALPFHGQAVKEAHLSQDSPLVVSPPVLLPLLLLLLSLCHLI